MPSDPSHLPNRRELLALGGAAAALAVGQSALARDDDEAAANQPLAADSFRYCFNTSTVREKQLPLTELIDIVAKAGYQGIEPWMNEIVRHEEQGGSLADVRKRLDDAGLAVESAIGFAAWIADDETARKNGLEALRRDMDRIAQLGGRRIAAPPAGATGEPKLNLDAAGERYRAALEVGRAMGVVPMLEVWGFSHNLGTLAETLHVAAAANHPDAALLLDVYHLHKGGSGFNSLRLVSGNAMPVMHLNDYPGDIPRETVRDADRVYPGDGAAPWKTILGHLTDGGFRGVFSLELFNPEYYKQDPLEVAKTGLAKMKQAVAQGLVVTP